MTSSGGPLQRRWMSPLAARLALAFVAVALVAVAALATVTVLRAGTSVDTLAREREDRTTAAVVDALEDAWRASAGRWDPAALGEAVGLTQAGGGELTVADRTGRTVLETSFHSMHGHHGDMVARDPVPVAVDGAIVGTARFAFPDENLLEAEQHTRDAVSGAVALGAGIALLVALAAAVWAARRVTRPVARLTDAARRIAGGDPSARAGVADAPGELGELARAFDALAESLQQEDEVRQALTADVAHELRTPLTVMRAELEELLDGLVDPTPERIAALHSDVIRLARIVTDLETLAAARAARLDLRVTDVDLGELVAGSVDRHRIAAERAGLTLIARIEPVHVAGDPDRLGQVIDNLVGNAVKFTGAGRITVTAGRDDGDAVVTISDTGPGLVGDDTGRIFERFHRGSAADRAGGAGIGLAVAADLVAAHHGTITGANRNDGPGAVFTVRIPVGR